MKQLFLITALLLLSPLAFAEDIESLKLKCDGQGTNLKKSGPYLPTYIILNIGKDGDWLEVPNFIMNINNQGASFEQKNKYSRREINKLKISESSIEGKFKVRLFPPDFGGVSVNRLDGHIMIESVRMRFQGTCEVFKDELAEKKF
jgi:hypothetical protein